MVFRRSGKGQQMEHDRPWISTDCVVFDERGRVLLIRRKNDPFKGEYAFPGGFIEVGETAENCAVRELKEETGIEAGNLRLIGVYSDPNRDPRHHSITVAYLVSVHGQSPVAGDDAAAAEFVEDATKEHLAFDHDKILRDALKLRGALRSPERGRRSEPRQR
jgi:8-oxo-dGTP diphosphatase